MAELKTEPTRASVPAFLKAIAEPARRADAQAICALMKTITGEKPVLWGDSIVGFGAYDGGAAGTEALLKRLRPHTTGKACLYVKRLSDLDQKGLGAIIARSVSAMRARYPA